MSNKEKYLHKIFCQIKQNYTKNELHSTVKTVKHIWVVCKDLWLLNFIFIASLYHSLVFNLLVSNNCSICVKAALKKIQQLSSLFYLMFWILVKQLKICKHTSKIFYSHKKVYTTMYLKFAKRVECSSRWCKMSYRHLNLYIVIDISN